MLISKILPKTMLSTFMLSFMACSGEDSSIIPVPTPIPVPASTSIPVATPTPVPSSTATVSYTANEDIFPNPERGFYHHTETFAASYSLLSSETLSSYVTNENITQILRVFYLSNTGDISQDYLTNMQSDFDAAREAGVKVIVRFAYSQGVTAPYNDASPDVVLAHIQQLSSVLQNNSDVITVMQAGFIGTWGEWYFTDHFAQSPGVLTEQNWADRKSVTDAILYTLPSDRMMQLRTPLFKQSLYELELSPLTNSNAFDGSILARTGHHNDCFLASETDFGTYVNVDQDKIYLGQETRFVAMGGETCAVSEYTACPNALNDLSSLHFSYLNIDYNADVLNQWRTEGCFHEVEKNLGYRLRLIEGTFTNLTAPGNTLSIRLNMINEGFASFYNPRPVNFILKNNEVSYVLSTGVDARSWPLGEAFNLELVAGLPVDMMEGDYTLSIQLPDGYETLASDSVYSVRFANQDVWDVDTGVNQLSQSIRIDNGVATDAYVGSLFFALDN